MVYLLSIAFFIIPCVISTAHYKHFEERIVNGIPISADSYPWMVSLRYQADNVAVEGTNYTVTLPHFCGASLIELSPPIVMTAAHCIDGFGYHSDGRITESLDPSSPVIAIVLDLNRTREQRDASAVEAGTSPSPSPAYETLYVYDSNMVYIHYGWNGSDLTGGNDIALFIIDDNQTISMYQRMNYQQYNHN